MRNKMITFAPAQPPTLIIKVFIELNDQTWLFRECFQASNHKTSCDSHLNQKNLILV